MESDSYWHYGAGYGGIKRMFGFWDKAGICRCFLPLILQGFFKPCRYDHLNFFVGFKS